MNTSTLARTRWFVLFASLTECGFGCRRTDPSATTAVIPSAMTSTAIPTPVDRLLPGELGTSSELVFGFPVPNGMLVDRAFPDAAHLVGEVTVSGLIEYIRKHAQVGPVELAGSTMRFDRVHIPSQGASRQYRFELTQRGRQVRLVVEDTTPPPLQPGLSEQERWRQAGLKPDGQPLDITELR